MNKIIDFLIIIILIISFDSQLRESIRVSFVYNFNSIQSSYSYIDHYIGKAVTNPLIEIVARKSYRNLLSDLVSIKFALVLFVIRSNDFFSRNYMRLKSNYFLKEGWKRMRKERERRRETIAAFMRWNAIVARKRCPESGSPSFVI